MLRFDPKFSQYLKLKITKQMSYLCFMEKKVKMEKYKVFLSILEFHISLGVLSSMIMNKYFSKLILLKII